MIKYIIDKGVQLECETDKMWRPIHFIFNYSTIEICKYIISKKVNLDCQTIEGWRPISLAINRLTPELVECLIIQKHVIMTNYVKKYCDKDCNMTIFDLLEEKPLVIR